MKKLIRKSLSTILGAVSALFAFSGSAFAASSTDICSLTANIQTQLTPIINLIVAGCYVAGTGFTAGAIFKFKAHKDNPTQNPMGTAVMYLFVGIALLFLPSMVNILSNTAAVGSAGFSYSGGSL
jgi:intracellular multiplication protein IcmD